MILVVKVQAMASAKAAVKKPKAERQGLGVKVKRQLAASTKQKVGVGLELGAGSVAGGAGDGGGGGGGGGSSSQSGPETVLLPPSMWTSQDPVLQCEPPCIFVLPPYQLSTTTSVTFPLYMTTLDVAWLTTMVTTASGGAVSMIESYTRTLQKTVLRIPPRRWPWTLVIMLS